MAKAIVVGDQKYDLIDAPTTGDVVINADGVAVVGSGKITVDMLATALKQFLFPVAMVGQGKVGYCTIGQRE